MINLGPQVPPQAKTGNIVLLEQLLKADLEVIKMLQGITQVLEEIRDELRSSRA